jgi:hypothetical protein
MTSRLPACTPQATLVEVIALMMATSESPTAAPSPRSAFKSTRLAITQFQTWL